MQFNFIFRFLRPKMPVKPIAAASFTVTNGADLLTNLISDNALVGLNKNMDTKITPQGGSLEIRCILAGFLFIEDLGATGKIFLLQLSKLDANGKPKPELSAYHLAYQLKTQLMPLPAKIAYGISVDNGNTFEINDPILRPLIIAYLINLLPSGRNASTAFSQQEKERLQINIKTKTNGSYIITDFPQLYTDFKAGKIGFLMAPGNQFYAMDASRSLFLAGIDLKNYSAVDEPLAVLDGINPGPQGANAIQEFFKTEEMDLSNPAIPVPITNATNFNSSIIIKSIRINNGNQNRFIVNHVAFKSELDAFVKLNGNPVRQKVSFNKYEKFALHPTNLRWHFKNWFVSGFLDPSLRNDAFITGLLNPGGLTSNFLYPVSNTTVLNNYPTNGRNINPPDVQINSYNNGETLGEERPNYKFVDFQRFSFRLKRDTNDVFSTTRSAIFPVNNPATAVTSTHAFTFFHYKGGHDMEEYFKRVSAHEYGLQRPVNDLELEGLKAQMIAARTYFIFWMLEGRGNWDNFLKNDYQEQAISHTANFHVHKLDSFNLWVRTEEKRLILEEAISDTWGQVATFKGKIIDAEFYAGDATQNISKRSNRDYKIAVRTKFGIDVNQLTSSTYKNNHGNGVGFSQKGAHTLADRGLSYKQIIHWYYFGIQTRNAFGQGDILTEPPTNNNTPWAVAPFPSIPISTSVRIPINTDNWVSANAFHPGHLNEDWFVAHQFKAIEYAIPDRVASRLPTNNLDQNKQLVELLQIIRSKSGVGIDIALNQNPKKVTIVVPILNNNVANMQTVLNSPVIQSHSHNPTISAPTAFLGLGSPHMGWIIEVT